MDNPEDLTRLIDETIVIAGRSDIDYWCQRLSISPFTLFHLLKTVGNNPKQIGEFLHKYQGQRPDKVEEPRKKISIL